MDEKQHPGESDRLLPGGEPIRWVRVRREGGCRRGLSLILSMLLLLWLWMHAMPLFFPCHGKHDTDLINTRKVALEAHIMSKCPDARDCLEKLVVPTMANVSDKVDFALSYIGSISTDDNSVECMHGPEECLGNIIQLCAADLYPDPKIYLGFANCMTGDLEHIPQKDLVQGCALEHGMDFDSLNHCVSKDDGAFGMDLLRNSVTRTANANVTKSCTVRLDGEIRCIRDGGEWKDCPGGSTVEDLIRDIKEAGKKDEN